MSPLVLEGIGPRSSDDLQWNFTCSNRGATVTCDRNSIQRIRKFSTRPGYLILPVGQNKDSLDSSESLSGVAAKAHQRDSRK